MDYEERRKIEQQIINLKSDLESRESEFGDWKLSKYQEYALDGKEAPFDIHEFAFKRQAIRDEINRLETELNAE